MRSLDIPKLSAAAVLFACALALPVALPRQVAAQTNPMMTNVIPDGGEFAVQGKLTALDPGAGALTIAPQSGGEMPMTVAPNIDLSNVSVGDVADVHYTRSVTFVLGTPQLPVGEVPVTSTVDEIARTPGGIGFNPAVIVARVTQLNGPGSIDVVNANGGGIYSIRTTNPSRQAVIGQLHVGDSVTVHVSPLIATSVAKCGLFGKGWFGC
jgi:hypothetical protein